VSVGLSGAELPILHTVGVVYRDVVRAARAMPVLYLVAAIVLLAANVLDLLGAPRLKDWPLGLLLMEIGVRVAESFLLTPFLIAIHRFILRDEVERGYPIRPLSARFERYFVWSLLLWLLMASVSLVVRPLTLGTPPLVGTAIELAATVIVVFVALRLSILFPAVAMDAPGASGPNAFADTGGHVIRILLILVLTVVPVIALFLLIALAVFSPDSIAGEFNAGSAAFAVALVVLQLVVYSLLVAVTSRVFQAYAKRVLEPPSA
jgi:hypothetical protein